jgi:hypothetical protein
MVDMKRVSILAMLSLTAAAMVACSDDDGDAATNASPDPVPGSGGSAPAAGENPGQVPVLDFGTPPAQPTPDAGPPPPADAAPNVVPAEPGKRTIWAVDDQNHLLRVLAADPADVIDVAALDLPAGEQVVGLDFRPANGALYVLSTGSRIYTVDLVTAKVTAVGGETSPRVEGQSFGFDVNPVADKIRVHSDVDQNLRLDPVTGAVAGTDTPLSFAPTDPNFRQSPNLVGAAYTNSVAPTPTSTQLFAIDSTRNILVQVANPNDGLITTVGPLGVDILAVAGFDIWGPVGTLEGYVAAQAQGTAGTGLYQVNTLTGALTLVGPIAHPRQLRGIAVRP